MEAALSHLGRYTGWQLQRLDPGKAAAESLGVPHQNPYPGAGDPPETLSSTHWIAEIVLTHWHAPSPENSHYAHQQMEKHPMTKSKGGKVNWHKENCDLKHGLP